MEDRKGTTDGTKERMAGKIRTALDPVAVIFPARYTCLSRVKGSRKRPFNTDLKPGSQGSTVDILCGIDWLGSGAVNCDCCAADREKKWYSSGSADSVVATSGG